MYFATGFGLIQCVKALMSFEDEVCWDKSLGWTAAEFELAGLVGCHRTHETWKCYRKPAPKESCRYKHSNCRTCLGRGEHVWHWLDQDHDCYGATRRTGTSFLPYRAQDTRITQIHRHMPSLFLKKRYWASCTRATGSLL